MAQSGVRMTGPTIKVFRHIDQSPAAFRRAQRQAMFQVGQDIVRTVVTGIERGRKTGRVYRLRKGGKIVSHRASAPGEFPAIITGELVSSWNFEVRGNQMEVGSTDPNAVFLDGGTKNMKPRALLTVAVKEREKVSFNHFERMARLALGKL